MKSFTLFLSIILVQSALAQDVRVLCKKMDAIVGDPHPSEMNLYFKTNNPKNVQIKFDNISLLGDIKETQLHNLYYTNFTKYDPSTKTRIGQPQPDLLQIATTLAVEGEPFEGGDPRRSPNGAVFWTTGNTRSAYSCLMTLRQ